MAETADAGFESLKSRLERLIGWDLGRFKANYLRRRVEARRRAVGAATWDDYAGVLSGDTGELERLKDRLTVHVTEFFRDPPLWLALDSDVLPGLFAAAAARPRKELRLWSAGCSSGEEAYSLAMLALKRAREQGRGVRVRVLAGDLNRATLDRARAGVFGAAALQSAPPQWLGDFFEVRGRACCAGPELRRTVAFRQQDLFSCPPPPMIDLLLCRNVMIYFSRDTQQRLLRAFHQALRPRGIFVTGKTETILGPVRERFRCLSATERIFERV